MFGGKVDRRRDELAVGDDRRQRRQPPPGSRVGCRPTVVVAVPLVVPVAVVVVDDVVYRLLVEPEVVSDVRAQSSTPSRVVVVDDVRVRCR